MIRYLLAVSFLISSQAEAIKDEDLKSLAPISSQRATYFLRLAANTDLFERDIELSESLQAKYREYLTGSSQTSVKKVKKVDTSSLKREIKPRAQWLIDVYLKQQPKQTVSTHRVKEASKEGISKAEEEAIGLLQMQVDSLKAIPTNKDSAEEVQMTTSGDVPHRLPESNRYELLVTLRPINLLSRSIVQKEQGRWYKLILKRKVPIAETAPAPSSNMANPSVAAASNPGIDYFGIVGPLPLVTESASNLTPQAPSAVPVDVGTHLGKLTTHSAPETTSAAPAVDNQDVVLTRSVPVPPTSLLNKRKGHMSSFPSLSCLPVVEDDE